MGFLIVIGVLLVVVVLIALFVIGVYNGLIGKREMVRNSLGQIAAQIESRWDAVKNLIDATKAYSDHEAKILTEVTESRASIGKGANVKELENDSAKFEGVMGRLIAVAENYPDLKASQVYQTTMASVKEFENNVRHSRMIYNDTVTKYNREIQIFPQSIVAGMFGFRQEDYFQSTESKNDMPSWS